MVGTIQELEIDIVNRISPKDKLDTKNIILETRSGVGGAEASLFNEEVFAMLVVLLGLNSNCIASFILFICLHTGTKALPDSEVLNSKY